MGCPIVFYRIDAAEIKTFAEKPGNSTTFGVVDKIPVTAGLFPHLPKIANVVAGRLRHA
jgi:hypothetical protein